MSPRTTVRKGLAAKAQAMTLLVGLTLAGCAAEPPVDPASSPPPPCDLVCRFLRLLDLDEPPPPPAPPIPPVRPRPKPSRAAHATRHQAMPPLRPTLVAPLAMGAPAPPPSAPFQPPSSPLALAPAAAEPAGAEPADTLPGSPGITPPWFQPWTSPGQP